MITLEITILAHQEAEEENFFTIEIFFRRVIKGTLIPQTIEELRIVFRYLWPNPYNQTAEEETARALSRVSLATGITASGLSTPEPSPSQQEELQEVPLQGEEESPLPIPDPTGINSLTPSSEQDLNERFSNNMRESLERHLGTIIEETFRERSQTLE